MLAQHTDSVAHLTCRPWKFARLWGHAWTPRRMQARTWPSAGLMAGPGQMSGRCLRHSTGRRAGGRAFGSGPRHCRAAVAAAPRPARPTSIAAKLCRTATEPPSTRNTTAPPRAGNARPPEPPAPVTPAPHPFHHLQFCPKNANARLTLPRKIPRGPRGIISPAFFLSWHDPTGWQGRSG